MGAGISSPHRGFPDLEREGLPSARRCGALTQLLRQSPTAFVRDTRGQSLRAYALAVALAALVVVVVLTLVAERVYIAFLRLFGP